MDGSDIQFLDLNRILFGTAPLSFLVEAACRTLIMYVSLLVTLRLLGKRMNGQMTFTELAVMLMLGAIVSVPMEIPERGLVPAFTLLVMVLVCQRGLNFWSFHNDKVRKVVQGQARLLVKDGVLQTEELTRSGIAHGQICASLRESDVTQLGQVERAYLETNGRISLILRERAENGLSIIPELCTKSRGEELSGRACQHCGTVVEQSQIQESCPNCDHGDWTTVCAA